MRSNDPELHTVPGYLVFTQQLINKCFCGEEKKKPNRVQTQVLCNVLWGSTTWAATALISLEINVEDSDGAFVNYLRQQT